MFMKNLCTRYRRLVVVAAAFGAFVCSNAQAASSLRGFKTNTDKRVVDLSELKPAGVGKDGIPAIDRPRFVPPRIADNWLRPREPVIAVHIGRRSKAYPLQILIWHEIVNDQIGDVPIAVTFCPLCYSAIVFDRRIQGKTHTFGVSGFLRHSDMVMYDRRTETLFQQFTGEGLVGDHAGVQLKRLPAQIISFGQFRNSYPNGDILSRRTGYNRSYGRNPYVGYDDIGNSPFLYKGPTDGRLAPMQKLITVSIGETHVAYPYSVTERSKVINDDAGSEPIVVFHVDGALSALDSDRTTASKHIGSTGVFSRRVAGDTLDFYERGGEIRDQQTQSSWDITGKAIKGRLRGVRLAPIPHGDYFAFAWLVFRPQTRIYKPEP